MTMWNNVILCLGSNTDCEANLKSAASLLRAYFGSIRFSEAIYTEPIGLPDSGLFLNQVAVAGTNASLEEVRRAVKAMEKRLMFSLLLGVVMVVAFAAQYPYVSTRTYSTFPIPVPYTVQYFPMCLAGAYMALESLRQMAEHVAEKARGSRAQV